MRVSKEKVVEHRRRILETAARLFRERGFSDVGVAEIMQASGLTHGAFYGHFQSKADLVSEACRAACAQGRETWEAHADLSAIMDRYLSPSHRDNPAKGCAIAAFSGEIARQPAPIQHEFAQSLARSIALIEERLEVADPSARRLEAVAIMSSMVGAVTLARGVAADDPTLSAEVLQSLRTQLRQRLGV